MKCKSCGTPLKGLRYHVKKVVKGVKRSKKYPGVCSTCEPMAKPKKRAVKRKVVKKKPKKKPKPKKKVKRKAKPKAKKKKKR